MENNNGNLKRGLKPRHVEMIAIGGVIGTGLFLGTGITISQAGGGGAPLAYLLIGIVVYFLIYGLGELATYMPVSGSFQTYSDLFVSPALGFALGWNYWLSWALTLAFEVVAASLILTPYFPGVPPVIWCILIGGLVIVLNLLSVGAYGEAEFWFAGIKVATIIAFIIIGLLLIFGVIGNQGYIGFANWASDKGGAFPNGVGAIFTVAITACAAYGGTEVIGIAAGETQDPSKSIPKAVKTVFFRILLFYVGSIAVLGLLLPYSAASAAKSPYTMVFSMAGFKWAALFMDMVIWTAVSSAANSSIFVCSRTMVALAQEGKAPKYFAKINSRGVPARAIAMVAIVACVALLTSFISPDKVFAWLLGAVGLAIMFSWMGIALSHINFHKWLIAHGGKVENLKFKSSFYPYGSYIVLASCIVCIIGQALNPAATIASLMGIPLFIILFLVGKYMEKQNRLICPNIDFEGCNKAIDCQFIHDERTQQVEYGEKS